MNNIAIRAETARDYDEIYKLIKTAFETAKVKDGTEQDYTVKLRNSVNYIPELALVAENNGVIIGQVMLTKINVKSKNSSEEFLLLAPICVTLSHRNKGVGGQLINRSFELARKMGYKAVFLCGDSNYYSRFGFKETVLCDIHNENDIPSQFALVSELCENALKDISGTINFL